MTNNPFRHIVWTPPSRLVAALIVSATLPVASTASAQETRITQAAPRNSTRPRPPSVKAFVGPVIPGLRQNAIPQGITFAPDQKRILISHYMERAPAFVSVLNASSGVLLSSITLQDPTGQFHVGRAGGIAVLGDSLFVASDGDVLRYKLGRFLLLEPPTAVRALSMQKCETAASFCTATNDLLLVGEFAYGKHHPTDSSHHLKDRAGGAQVCVGLRL